MEKDPLDVVWCGSGNDLLQRIKNYPRRFFNSRMNEKDRQYSTNDNIIARENKFSRFGFDDNYWGGNGIVVSLNDLFKKIRNRYDYLITGNILPQLDIDVEDMSDDELAEQMKKLQDILDKRLVAKEAKGK